jgi:DNA-binding protein H-NS
MARLQELLVKKAKLDQEIEQTQRKERSAAVAHIRTLMEQYGLTVADLSGAAPGARRGRPPQAAKTAATGKKPGRPAGKRTSTLKGKKVAAKFRNKATGDTWSGRGLQPRWLREALGGGKKLSDFAV